MTDSFPLTPQLLHRIAVTLNTGEIGAIENLAGLVREDSATVAAWCAGTEPIPDGLLADLLAVIGGTTPYDPAWRRDEWLLGLASPHAADAKRIYLIHLWTPRFRCRAIEIDPETGHPVESQEPADVDKGINYPVTDELVLAEFEWIDRPPRPDHLVQLLEAAAEALRQLIEGA